MPAFPFLFLPTPSSDKQGEPLAGVRGNGRGKQVSRKAGESSILLTHGSGPGPHGLSMV